MLSVRGIRYWLIERLAGQTGLVLNMAVRAEGDRLFLDPVGGPGKNMYFADSRFNLPLTWPLMKI